MAKAKMRKVPGKGPMDVDSLDGLSSDEKARLYMATHSKPGFTSPEGSVSQKFHEDTVNDLKRKAEELERKLEECKGDLAKARQDRDEYKGRFESKMDDNKALIGENDGLKKETSRLRERVSGLESRLEKASENVVFTRDDTEIERLGKDVADLKGNLEDSEKRREALESEKGTLEEEIGRLRSEVEELRSSVLTEPEEAPVPQVSGTVRRTSPTVFESVLFTDGRYMVKLARSGRTISFKPDVEGTAVCKGGRISLPKLASLVPFDGESEYEVYRRDDSEIVVPLF